MCRRRVWLVGASEARSVGLRYPGVERAIFVQRVLHLPGFIFDFNFSVRFAIFEIAYELFAFVDLRAVSVLLHFLDLSNVLVAINSGDGRGRLQQSFDPVAVVFGTIFSGQCSFSPKKVLLEVALVFVPVRKMEHAVPVF